MTSDILSAIEVSSSGMRAQGTRLRTISENIANADTPGVTPGSDPYRRQRTIFKNQLDREMGVKLVQVEKVDKDLKTPFRLKFDPGNPAADAKGYVKLPNVNSLIEIMDAREAQRSYEANLGMIEQSRSMILRTIDLLRG